MQTRYVNVKVYKRSRGPCILTACRTSATVTATRKRNGKQFDLQLCARHAELHGVTQ